MAHASVPSAQTADWGDFRGLFDHTHDAVFIDDLHGRVRAANHQATVLTGRPLEDIVGRSVADFCAPEEAGDSMARYESLLAGEPQPLYERTFLRVDGTRVPTEINAHLIADLDGNPRYLQAIVRDISDRKKAEAMVESLLASAMSGAGEQFFGVVAEKLATSFGLRGAFCAERAPDSGSSLRLLGWYIDNRHRDLTTYDCRDEPCERVIGDSEPKLIDVAADYPNAMLATRFGVETYYAVPIIDPSGVSGTLGVLHDGPIPELETIERVLRILAGRAGVEIERIRTDRRAQEARRTLQEAEAIAHLGSWTVNLKTGHTWWSDEMFRIAGQDPATFELSADNCLNCLHPDDRDQSKAVIPRLLETGEDSFEIDERLVRPDGTIRYLSSRGRLERDEAGEPALIRGACHDVTDQRAVEQRLGEMAATIKEVFWICEVAEDGRRLAYVSPAFEQVWGIEPIVVMQDRGRLLRTVRPDCREVFESAVVAQDAGNQTDIEYAIVRADGEERWIWDQGFPVVEDGRTVRVMGISVDITEKRSALEALAESEARLQEAQRLAQLGYWEWSVGSTELWWSEQTFNIFDRDPATTPTYEAWVERIHEADVDKVQGAVQHTLEHATPYDIEHRVVRGDGTERIVHCIGHAEHDPEGKPLRVFGTIVDITERHRAQEALHKHRELLSEAQQLARIGHWEWNLADNAQVWSDQTRVLLGLAPDAPPTFENFAQRLHPEDAERVLGTIGDAAGSGDAFSVDHKLVQPDGTELYIHCQGRCVKDEDGAPVSVVGTMQDVTEQRLASRALEENESRFRAMAETITEVFWVSDPGMGQVIYVSPAFEKIWGRTPDVLLANPTVMLDTVHPDDREAFLTTLAAQGSGEATEVEYRIHVEGRERWIWDRGFPVFDSVGTLRRVNGIAVDITERKLAERRVKDLNATLEQRVEERTRDLRAANAELEAFSYSVSHDLKAPLRAINGFADILVEDHLAQLDEEAQHVVEVIREGAVRMGALIDDLLEYSRVGRQEIKPARVDMASVCREVLDDLAAGLKDRPAIQVEIGTLPTVVADPVLTRRIISNLLDNAVKFTDGVEEPRITVAGSETPRGVTYTVSDNGVGFNMQYASKLFGVFQRLHDQGQFPGTGVGLATVHRILERHGGSVTASSEIGVGTTVTFTLPSKPAEL